MYTITEFKSVTVYHQGVDGEMTLEEYSKLDVDCVKTVSTCIEEIEDKEK